MGRVFTTLQRLKDGCLDALSSRFTRWTKPLRTSLPLATLTDLGRSKSELIAENALLRQQLIMLRRQVKRPSYHQDRSHPPRPAGQAGSNLAAGPLDRATGHAARWHRELFRLFWKHKSKAPAYQPKVASATIALIRQMAKDNRLWGAERIRGELLKLGIHVCKRTIQKYMRTVRTRQPRGQKWAPFCATMPHRSGRATSYR